MKRRVGNIAFGGGGRLLKAETEVKAGIFKRKLEGGGGGGYS